MIEDLEINEVDLAFAIGALQEEYDELIESISEYNRESNLFELENYGNFELRYRNRNDLMGGEGGN